MLRQQRRIKIVLSIAAKLFNRYSKMTHSVIVRTCLGLDEMTYKQNSEYKRNNAIHGIRHLQ